MTLFQGDNGANGPPARDSSSAEDNYLDNSAKRRPGAEVVTVSVLNQRARRLLEGSFAPLWVRGELSNFTRAASGHWYFSLKDAQAQVRCAMFRARNLLLGWTPADGMAVEVFALATLYEARGEFQLSVDSMRRAGMGNLHERFAKLKAKLLAEGLFDVERKRALPRYARTIGIITSTAAAALRDVLTTLRRRAPHIRAIVYPTLVQGDAAATQIVMALQRANARAECDVLLLCRGGGSIEDLWSFNEESVARAIAASRIPVVCGVGHETDFTIADFAADMRAPTPTAAAQLASPDRAELQRALAQSAQRLQRAATRRLENAMQAADILQHRLIHPRERLARQQATLQQLARRLAGAAAQHLQRRAWQTHQAGLHWQRAAPALLPRQHQLGRLHARLRTHTGQQLAAHAARLRALASNLDHLNPQGVLERGYSIVRDTNGVIVRGAATLHARQKLELQFARGQAAVTVDAVNTEQIDSSSSK